MLNDACLPAGRNAKFMIKVFFKELISNLKFQIFFEEIFIFLTVSLAVFAVMELIQPRIVLAYINLSWLLLAWLVFGFLCLFVNKDK
jgi:hypothetical protein